MASGKLVSDDIANEAVTKVLESSKKDGKTLILDGYPRTPDQATYLAEHYSKIYGKSKPLVAINIEMEKFAAIEKVMGRRSCKTCKQVFNIANIIGNGYDMPALLPTKESCGLEDFAKCNPDYETRVDDNLETIEKRFEEYDSKTKPLLDFYSQQGMLKTFIVKKGVKDTDELLSMMTST